MAQILRYSETPVGPYDELALLPGYRNGVGPEGSKLKDSRIMGIWVSQETTLMNGRRNWNIPKFDLPSSTQKYSKLISISTDISHASSSLSPTPHLLRLRSKCFGPIPLQSSHSSLLQFNLLTTHPPFRSTAHGLAISGSLHTFYSRRSQRVS